MKFNNGNSFFTSHDLSNLLLASNESPPASSAAPAAIGADPYAQVVEEWKKKKKEPSLQSPTLIGTGDHHDPVVQLAVAAGVVAGNPFQVNHRKRTSRHQLAILESFFARSTRPNSEQRRELAALLGMTPRGVQIWFQNRRAKVKMRNRDDAYLRVSQCVTLGGTGIRGQALNSDVPLLTHAGGGAENFRGTFPTAVGATDEMLRIERAILDCGFDFLREKQGLDSVNFFI